MNNNCSISILIAVLFAMIGLLIGWLIGTHTTRRAEPFKEQTVMPLGQIDDLSKWYNFSTVDWSALDSLYYLPYNCDWGEEIDEKMVKDFPEEEACLYWSRLKKAKTLFHQQTLPLRSQYPEMVNKQIERTEAAFDSVFVACVTQEYYMRLFVDCYEAILPLAIDSFYRTLNDLK